MKNVLCYDCGGEGVLNALVYMSSGRREALVIPCTTCGGGGLVSKERKALWDEGRRRRDIRLAANLSQREMADTLGLDVADYSKMEHGRRPWPVGSGAEFAALAGGGNDATQDA